MLGVGLGSHQLSIRCTSLSHREAQRSKRKKTAGIILCLFFFVAESQAQAVKFRIRVVDETGVAVADARIVLEQSATQTLVKGETDAAGRHEFDVTNAGSYQLKIEKEGFYASTTDVRVGEESSLEVTIYHQQEIAETVNVYDSPPAIDPGKTANAEAVTSREILTLSKYINRQNEKDNRGG